MNELLELAGSMVECGQRNSDSIDSGALEHRPARRTTVARRALVLTFQAMRFLLFTLLWVAPATALAQPLHAREAVGRAAQQNPTLRASIADARAAREAVLAQDAARLPVFYSSASSSHTEGFIPTTEGVIRTDSRGFGLNTGLRYTTELGTEFDLSIGGDVSWRSTNLTPASAMLVRLGPIYSTMLTLAMRQPLMRGAGDDATLAALREARASRDEADHTRDDDASQLALGVLTAYWELWYADRALRVQSDALGLAETQLRESRIRAEQLGTTPQTDVLRFRSEIASIRSQLTSTRSTREVRTIELALLLGAPLAEASDLATADDPPEIGAPPPLARLLESASSSSSVLVLFARLDAGRERARLAVDSDQIRLDMTVTLTGRGLWNDDSLDGLQLPDGRPALTGIVGLELELPLGDTPAAAEHRRAMAQVEASEARYEALLQSVCAEVARLRTSLLTASEQVMLTTDMADVSGQLAEAERTRLQLGTTTPTEVLQAQQSHREAELAHLRAIVDQVETALQLDHRVGQLLERYALGGGR